MHVGRTYPFHFSYWQCEVLFWPGYVPRKLRVHMTAANGDFWDTFLVPMVSDVGVPDVFIPGDIVYPFSAILAPATFEVIFHKVATFPKRYSITAHLDNGLLSSNLASLEIGPEVRTFGPFFPTLDSGPDLPVFNGNVPSLQIRAATWSEV